MTIAPLNRTALGRPALDRIRHANGVAEAAAIALPSWVDSALGGRTIAQQERTSAHHGLLVTVRDAGPLALCSTRIEHMAGLSPPAIRESVTRAFLSLFDAADGLRARHRVRMWSFIPDIHADRGGGLNTYHLFNQGRFDAFAQVLGGDDGFAGQLPTATGIGQGSPHLDIHLLVSATPGVHIENPRQVPAYRYSSRFGPRPPCFARGTVIQGTRGPVLLVGGTASVRDECSMYAGDLAAQLDETFMNLSTLTSLKGIGDAGTAGRFTHVRAYAPPGVCMDTVESRVRERLGAAASTELVRANICREELMVEIEGVVEW